MVHRFKAIDRGIPGTGHIAVVGDVEWAEVETPVGRGWVEAQHLTEQVDQQTFTDDPSPERLLRRLVEALEDDGDLTDLVSQYGLWVSHHADPVTYTPRDLATLMTTTTTQVWRGRNPAYPDTEGTFSQVIGAGLLEAWSHPQRVLTTEGPAVPSTALPVEYTNLHAISIATSLTGRKRLDQNAWLVFFTYEDNTPRLAALVKEG